MRFLKVIAVNVLLLLAGLIVTDVVFGDWFTKRNIGDVRILKDADLRFDASKIYGRKEPTIYRRDQWGLRGSYPDVASIDLLTIGGSTTDQRYLTEGETWQDALQQELDKARIDIQVANGGADGHSTRGHIRSFDYWYSKIPDLHPKYVLLYIGINEIYTEFHKWSDDIRKDHLRGRIRQLYQNNSVYYRLYTDFRGWLTARHAKLAHHKTEFGKLSWTDKPMHANHAEKMAERVAAYEKRLRQLLPMVKEFGAIPILVTQAKGDAVIENGKWIGLVDGETDMRVFWEVNNGLDRRIVLNFFNDVTMRVCYETPGAICVPLHEELLFEKDDFYDFVHNTPKGASKIGRYLKQKLAGVLTPP